MRLKPDQMYDRVVASDPSFNGRFFFGVATTGIYCLPSCGARKPLRKNTLFFQDAAAARAAGLRPCRKCRPDDFARGADPVLETVEAVVAEMRANPGAFADARAVVKRLGFGPTRAFELFRLHHHATPAEILLRARLETAKARLLGPVGSKAPKLAAVAEEVGFESLSAFHENFRARNGMTPAEWRALVTVDAAPDAAAFNVSLPERYLLGYLRRHLGRDKHSLTERLDGDLYVAGHRFARGPGLLKLRLAPDAIRVECPPGAALEAHRVVLGLLGLEQDAAGFARLTKKLGLGRLTAGREELRVTQAADAFDGLMWAVLGQQINMPFAFLLRRRLTELAGEVAGEHGGEPLYAPPSPRAVAALEPEALLPHQFSRQKADYVVSIARRVASGNLDLEAMRGGSATRAERALLAVRGLGPWSVNYVMMRALGFADCVPYGDTGVTSGLKALFELDERPDVDATRRLMAVFAPHRSLAVAHLWQLFQPEPA